LLLLLALLLLVTPVLAKGPVDKIIIDGPDLAKPIEITDPDILSRFDPWGGQFIGTGGPLAGPPSNIKEPYLVKFYLEDQQGELALRYMFYYYFNATGTTGYIYLPGPGEPYYSINTGTIIRESSDGEWHKALPGWDDVMTNVVAEAQGGSSGFAGLNLAQGRGFFLGSGVLLTIVVAYLLWSRKQPERTGRTVSEERPR
jgi:hypothetical protein